jgi:hypothetical protein
MTSEIRRWFAPTHIKTLLHFARDQFANAERCLWSQVTVERAALLCFIRNVPNSCLGLWWAARTVGFRVLCCPANGTCAQLENITHGTTTTSAHRPTTFTVHDYNITISAFK